MENCCRPKTGSHWALYILMEEGSGLGDWNFNGFCFRPGLWPGPVPFGVYSKIKSNYQFKDTRLLRGFASSYAKLPTTSYNCKSVVGPKSQRLASFHNATNFHFNEKLLFGPHSLVQDMVSFMFAVPRKMQIFGTRFELSKLNLKGYKAWVLNWNLKGFLCRGPN